MIIWGSGGDVEDLGVVSERDCTSCEKKRPFRVLLQYRYWGLYWIFNFVISRKYLLLCDSCQRGWELQRSEVEEHFQSVPIPFMRRYGLVSLVAILTTVILFAQILHQF